MKLPRLGVPMLDPALQAEATMLLLASGWQVEDITDRRVFERAVRLWLSDYADMQISMDPSNEERRYGILGYQTALNESLRGFFFETSDEASATGDERG